MTQPQLSEKCFICGKQMYYYRGIVPEEFPLDGDCGGNCWECQKVCEDNYINLDEARVQNSERND